MGVTSVTDGDPLGKPPTEAERILRVGIDVQANEVITTNIDDRAHLVFLDGTSLTVGPNARVAIDRFVFDPTTKTGDLAVTASKGVFRLVGGKISKTNPIIINTPSGTIGIRGGITIFDVQATKTTTSFVFGYGMTVTGQGQTQIVTRPGSQVTINTGTPPGLPTLVPKGGLSGQLKQLEGNERSANQATGRNADQGAQTYSKQNSGLGPGGLQGQGFGEGLGKSSNSVINALSNANVGVQLQELQTATPPMTFTTPVAAPPPIFVPPPMTPAPSGAPPGPPPAPPAAGGHSHHHRHHNNR